MADIIRSTADTSGFIPQYWANRALDVLRNQIVLARLITTDNSYQPGDFATKGKSITIPYPGTFSAVDKVEGTPVTPQVPSGGASVTLSLSKHKVVPFLVEDFANAQANTALMDRYLQPAVIALAEQVENDIFALYTSLTATALGTAGTVLTSAGVRSVRETLTTQKAPFADRSFVITPNDEANLLADSTVQQYFAFAKPETIREGSIGRLYGVDLYVSQLVPVVAGTPNANQNLAIARESFIWATRPFRPAPANSGVLEATATDPVSGISIRISTQYDINNIGQRVNLDILYGMTALRPALGVVFKS